MRPQQRLQRVRLARERVLLIGMLGGGDRNPGVTTGSAGGESRSVTFFRGTIICAGCSLEAARAANPALGHLYAFNSDRGQVVLNMDDADERMWWETIAGLSDRVWLRGPDQVLYSLLAEENLFKKVEVAGLLRKEGVLDVGSVTFWG